MIVSHEHRFIFVRTRKTAGTSVEIALSGMLGEDAVITSLSPRDEALRRQWRGREPQNHLEPGRRPAPGCPVLPGPGAGVRYYNHMAAADIRELVGHQVWQRYFTFCFERNPWDKVVSLYYHRYRTEPRPGIHRFLQSGEAADALNWPLYTEHGRPIVDLVGHYEDLDRDLRTALAQVGLAVPKELPQAKTVFRPAGRPYWRELGRRERAEIGELFRDEIAWHGYAWQDGTERTC
ncbi:sulfotransferase family protein [Streptomyces odontomachi]|uniref:sulfotransferase family protein n=1 Tax=Streptomyces odontomachi TaxID=2944940 RepID=UPI00210EAAB2|nr:sulfotransferase family protein [Streptomyces sp. ODS25]